MKLATLQADFSRWLQAECPDTAKRLGGGPGFNVYLNNYRGQLIAALESGFPHLRRWLGDTAFLAAAAHHIEACPPTAWTLDAYGRDFADTVAALYPNAPECAELARLEWALAAAFTTADVEAITTPALDTVDWQTARFHFVPSLTLLPVATNAAALWQALAADTPPPAAQPLPQPAVILLWRREFHPSFRSAERPEADALRQARAGTPFGALCETLALAHGPEDGATIAGGWLGGWLRDGLIAAIT